MQAPEPKLYGFEVAEAVAFYKAFILPFAFLLLPSGLVRAARELGDEHLEVVVDGFVGGAELVVVAFGGVGFVLR